MPHGELGQLYMIENEVEIKQRKKKTIDKFLDQFDQKSAKSQSSPTLVCDAIKINKNVVN